MIRNAYRLGLKDRFDCGELRVEIKSLAALAFAPDRDVITLFEELAGKANKSLTD